MRSSRAVAVLATVCGIPATGFAGLIAEPVQVVAVEWWGRVLRPFGSDEFARTYEHGKLRINLALAGPDFVPDDPAFGKYTYNPESCQSIDCPPRNDAPSGFVTNDHTSSDGVPSVSGDLVDVFDRDLRAGSPPLDGFRVIDDEVTPDFSLSSFITVEMFSPTNFINGKGLLQSFDIQPAVDGGSGRGVVTVFIDGVHHAFELQIDRLRATPRVCRP